MPLPIPAEALAPVAAAVRPRAVRTGSAADLAATALRALAAAGWAIVPDVVCGDCGRGPAPGRPADPCPFCDGVGDRTSGASPAAIGALHKGGPRLDGSTS